MLENGRARDLRLDAVERILVALGARLDIRVSWNGPGLDRLLDAGHAALGAAIKRRLEAWGWLVKVEVSYSRYGERGRIDLLALHASASILLVIELKTDLVDVQALLGSLDVKVRLARDVGRQVGWHARSVVPVIVFTEDDAVRRRVRQLDALFDRYPLRGREATGWLRRPSGIPTGLLWITALAGPRKRFAVGKRVYGSRG